MTVLNERTIKTLVQTAVEAFAKGFQARHEGEVDDPEGTINMKIHNVFIEVLGKEIQYYRPWSVRWIVRLAICLRP